MKGKIALNLTIFLFMLFSMSFLAGSVNAQGVDEMVWGGYYEEFQLSTGLSPKDPREMITGLIRIALGFLGILAVTIIMFAGFKLMVSGGNEDNMAKAKAMMANGAVGIIIVLISFSLANFVINSIINATQTI